MLSNAITLIIVTAFVSFALVELIKHYFPPKKKRKSVNKLKKGGYRER